MRFSRKAWLSLLAGAAIAPRAAAGQPRTIRFGTQTAETYAEGLFGADSGIFARHGLDVETTVFPSAGTISAALAGGAIDVGLIDAIVLANAFNRGLPMAAIAGGGLFETRNPTSALCVAKTGNATTAKNLEGQTVAVGTLVSLTSIAIKMWLQRGGANVADVRFVEMPFSAMPQALERGTVAAAYVIEPQLSQDAETLRVVAIPYGAIAPSFPISLLVSTRGWVAQNPDLARGLTAALYETARWANANHAQTAPILSKYTKLELGVIQHMARTHFATSLDARMVQPILDAAFAYKLIDRPTKAADLIMPA